MKHLFLFLILIISTNIIAQPKGFESYSSVPKCGAIEIDIKTMRPEVNADSLTTRNVYSYINNLSVDAIEKAIAELVRILELNELDLLKPNTIESSFAENVDNFDGKAIVKYLEKKTKDFVFEYRLADSNADSEIIWSFTYAVDNNGVRLRCEQYQAKSLYLMK